VIKSFRVNENFDFNILNDYETSHFLLDTYDLYNYGGSGKIFNWDLIPEQFRKKIILAGGVSVDNIEEISTRVDPSAVDVSSSLEEYPGKKDHKRVKKFFDKIKELRSREC
jgi:phosphoribosylanthranilate isomerase